MKNEIIANPFLQIISLFDLLISNKISLETSTVSKPEISSSLKRDVIIKRNGHYPFDQILEFFLLLNGKRDSKTGVLFFLLLNIICRTCWHALSSPHSLRH